MITLHHLNNSRSQRILWILEELSVEYRIERYERHPKTMFAPEALQKVHPLGKSPIITDGDVVVAESGAIIEYLIETYGNEWQPSHGTEAYRQYRYWLHFAEGSLMPPMLIQLVLSKIHGRQTPALIRPIARGIAQKVNAAFVTPNTRRLFNFVESHLQQQEWMAGDQISGADVQMSFPLEAAAARGLIDDQYPATLAYLKRIHSRPAYQAALKQGGDYAYAKPTA